MSDIFISYSSADRPRVKPLVDALGQQGWSVWWDRTILPGKTWDEVIEAALADARCVIVLWSRDSVQSDWVRSEADEAKRRGVLVPALLDEIHIPLEFNRIQTSNLASWSGGPADAEFQQLLKAVSEILSQSVLPVAHAALQTSGEAHGIGKAAESADIGRPTQEDGQEQRSSHAADDSAKPRATVAPAGFRWRIALPLGILVLAGTLVLIFVARGPQPLAKPLSTVTPETKSATPADEAAGISGNWEADVNYGDLWAPVNQSHHERFRFTVVGDGLVGTASLVGVPRAIRDGKVQGRNISFITVYDLTDGSRNENRYRGSISGGRIQFTFQDSREGGTIAFAATRVKP